MNSRSDLRSKLFVPPVACSSSIAKKSSPSQLRVPYKSTGGGEVDGDGWSIAI